jgi:hypothetical protein
VSYRRSAGSTFATAAFTIFSPAGPLELPLLLLKKLAALLLLLPQIAGALAEALRQWLLGALATVAQLLAADPGQGFLLLPALALLLLPQLLPLAALLKVHRREFCRRGLFLLPPLLGYWLSVGEFPFFWLVPASAAPSANFGQRPSPTGASTPVPVLRSRLPLLPLFPLSPTVVAVEPLPAVVTMEPLLLLVGLLALRLV